ncbi:MAG: type II toxin-antitoxin system RelE/ParE family toxin [Pseudomonadota bacterium]
MHIVICQKENKRVPVKDFFSKIGKDDPDGAAKCLANIRRLKNYGYMLHKVLPKRAEYLGEGIYYLRDRGKAQYRIFYFFFDTYVVLAHGFVKKQDEAPPGEIKQARQEKREFEREPAKHTWKGSLP